MSDPSVEALAAWIDSKRDKGNEMSVTDKDETDTVAEVAYRNGKTDGVNAYKAELVDLVQQYASQHNLCDEGVRAFCEDAGIEIKQIWSGDIIISLQIDKFGEDSAHEEFDSILRYLVRNARNVAIVNESVCEVQNIQREY